MHASNAQSTHRRLGSLLRLGRRPAPAPAVETPRRQEPLNFGRNGISPTPVVFHLNEMPVQQEFTLTALRTVKEALAKPAKDARPSLEEIRRRVDAMFANPEPTSLLPIF